MTAAMLPGLEPERQHPARYSAGLVPVLATQLVGATNVLDPMAGVGGIHEIGRRAGVAISVGVELEPEWANAHPRTIRGDARSLPFPTRAFAVVCVSPAYGNRMADDSHAWSDQTGRRTYSGYLGRGLTPGNGGALQWGNAYRALHAQAWSEAVRVLVPGGRFLLNVKDHVRNGHVQHVTDWHVETIRALGLTVTHRTEVATPSYGFGANSDRRCPEQVVALTRD